MAARRYDCTVPMCTLEYAEVCLGEPLQDGIIYNSADAKAIFLTDIKVTALGKSISGFKMFLNTMSGQAAAFKLQIYRPKSNNLYTLTGEATVPAKINFQGEFQVVLQQSNYIPVAPGDRLAILNTNSYVPLPYNVSGNVSPYVYSSEPALGSEITFGPLSYPISFSVQVCVTSDNMVASTEPATLQSSTPPSETTSFIESSSSTDTIIYAETSTETTEICFGEPLQDGIIYSSADSKAIFLTDIEITASGKSISGFKMFLNTMGGQAADFKLQIYRPKSNNQYTLTGEATVPAKINFQGEFQVVLQQSNYIPVAPGDRLAILNTNSYVPLPYNVSGNVSPYVYSSEPALGSEISFGPLSYPISFSVQVCVTSDNMVASTEPATLQSSTPPSETTSFIESSSSTDTIIYAETSTETTEICFGEPLQDGIIYSSADSKAIFLTDIEITASGKSISGFKMFLNTMSGQAAYFKLQIYRPKSNDLYTLTGEATVPAKVNFQGEFQVVLQQSNYIPVAPGDRLAILNTNSYVPLPYNVSGNVSPYVYSSEPALGSEITFGPLSYPISFSVQVCVTSDNMVTSTEPAILQSSTPPSETTSFIESSSSTDTTIYAETSTETTGICFGEPLQDGIIYNSADSKAIFLTDIEITASGKSISGFKMFLNTMSGPVEDFKLQIYRPKSNNLYTLTGEANILAKKNYQGEFQVNLQDSKYMSVAPGDRLAILNTNSYVPLPYQLSGKVTPYVYNSPPTIGSEIQFNRIDYPFSFSVQLCLSPDHKMSTTESNWRTFTSDASTFAMQETSTVMTLLTTSNSVSQPDATATDISTDEFTSSRPITTQLSIEGSTFSDVSETYSTTSNNYVSSTTETIAVASTEKQTTIGFQEFTDPLTSTENTTPYGTSSVMESVFSTHAVTLTSSSTLHPSSYESSLPTGSVRTTLTDDKTSSAYLSTSTETISSTDADSRSSTESSSSTDSAESKTTSTRFETTSSAELVISTENTDTESTSVLNMSSPTESLISTTLTSTDIPEVTTITSAQGLENTTLLTSTELFMSSTESNTHTVSTDAATNANPGRSEKTTKTISITTETLSDVFFSTSVLSTVEKSTRCPSTPAGTMCSENNGGCDHLCENALVGVICSCRSGFRLNSTDQSACYDRDECSVNNGGCQLYCTNIEGGHTCDCPDGYVLNGDLRSCLDLDECMSGKSTCSDTDICVNVPGSFLCFPGASTACEAFRANDSSVASLLSESTMIAFVVWLAILTVIIVLALLAVCFQGRGRNLSNNRSNSFRNRELATPHQYVNHAYFPPDNSLKGYPRGAYPQPMVERLL